MQAPAGVVRPHWCPQAQRGRPRAAWCSSPPVRAVAAPTTSKAPTSTGSAACTTGSPARGHQAGPHAGLRPRCFALRTPRARPPHTTPCLHTGTLLCTPSGGPDTPNSSRPPTTPGGRSSLQPPGHRFGRGEQSCRALRPAPLLQDRGKRNGGTSLDNSSSPVPGSQNDRHPKGSCRVNGPACYAPRSRCLVSCTGEPVPGGTKAFLCPGRPVSIGCQVGPFPPFTEPSSAVRVCKASGATGFGVAGVGLW